MYGGVNPALSVTYKKKEGNKMSEMEKYIQNLRIELSIAEAFAYFIDENDNWIKERINEEQYN
jgi:hypothetical protein